MDNPILYKKTGIAVTKLARDLLHFESGDHFPTIDQLCVQLDCSRGTLQTAIHFLVSEKCVLFKSHGKNGTFVEMINRKKLWDYTNWPTILAAMPLPSTLKLKGLTTAICQVLQEERHLPFHFAFMQSSETRANSMRYQKYDFIIVSKLSAQLIQKKYPDFEIAVEFNPYSYCEENILAFSDPTATALTDGMRIAYDPHSIDQAYLTDLLCRDLSVHKLFMPYQSTYDSLKRGEADAIICRKTSFTESGESINYQPIPFELTQGIDTIAVIMTDRNNYGMARFLQSLLRPDHIWQIQNEVCRGSRTFSFY